MIDLRPNRRSHQKKVAAAKVVLEAIKARLGLMNETGKSYTLAWPSLADEMSTVHTFYREAQSEDPLSLSTAEANYEMDRASAIVADIRRISGGTSLQAGMVAVYERVGDMLADDRLSECDRVLSAADPDITEPEILLAFLMASAAVPEGALPSRPRLFEATRARFIRDIGEPQAASLLDNLR